MMSKEQIECVSLCLNRSCHGWLNKMTSSTTSGRWKWILLRALEWLAPALREMIHFWEDWPSSLHFLGLYSCSLNSTILFLVMVAVIRLALARSRSSTNVSYCTWPFACIVLRHSIDCWSKMSSECSLKRSALSSSNGLPMPSIILTSGCTCVANSFRVALVCSWWFVWLARSFFPTMNHSNSDMTRTSSGPGTTHHKRAPASYVNRMTPFSSHHYFAHGHDQQLWGGFSGTWRDELAVPKILSNISMLSRLYISFTWTDIQRA